MVFPGKVRIKKPRIIAAGERASERIQTIRNRRIFDDLTPKKVLMAAKQNKKQLVVKLKKKSRKPISIREARRLRKDLRSTGLSLFRKRRL